MANLIALHSAVEAVVGDDLISIKQELGELTVVVESEQIVEVSQRLRDDERTQFQQLMDLCGVDYSTYKAEAGETWSADRFQVVYHLQSVALNHRVRVKASVPESEPMIDSVVDVWPAANWYEREAFDLYGLLFRNHPDLRRLLTDYGFIGHPFRKDFPISGHVEMRYDKTKGRVIYEPVSIDPRITTPRVIRD